MAVRYDEMDNHQLICAYLHNESRGWGTEDYINFYFDRRYEEVRITTTPEELLSNLLGVEVGSE